MKVRSLQFKVLVLVAGVMAIAIGVGVASLTRVYGTIQDLDRISREDFEAQTTVLRAGVAFKQQVQEWKAKFVRFAPSHLPPPVHSMKPNRKSKLLSRLALIWKREG